MSLVADSRSEVERELSRVLLEYPGLSVDRHLVSEITLTGILDIEASGVFIKSYPVRIVVHKDYPSSVPTVYETGFCVPRDRDRHINDDGSACLFVPDARWKHWPAGATLLDFIRGPVHCFFLSQAYFDLTGNWIFGERPHGDKGIIDFYLEEVGVLNPGSLYKCLALIPLDQYSANKRCPCGSGSTLLECHGIAINHIQKHVPGDRIAEVLGLLKRQRYLR